MVLVTPGVMVTRGFTFHALLCMGVNSGLYLVYLCSRAWLGNLSWQYINCTMCGGRGVLVFGFYLGVLLCIGCQVLVFLGIGVGAQVQLHSHSDIVDMSGLLLKFLTLISVKDGVHLLVCSAWAMRCNTMLWHGILRPFIIWLSHVDRKWAMCFWHCWGIGCRWGFGWVRGLKIFLLWFPMYWVYRNFRICIILPLDMPLAF